VSSKHEVKEHQLADVRAVSCLLRQAGANHILGRLTDCSVIKSDGRVEDVGQLLLASDAEGVVPVKHLVKNNSDGPNVHALVIFIAN
jgi:hypothetical protein